MKKTLILFLLLQVTGYMVRAAEQPQVYFSSQTMSYAPDSEFQVSVLLDSPQPINAIDLEIIYDPEFLSLLGFDTSDSIIDIWQNGPSLTMPNLISLRGGLFKAFEGERGLIIKLNFRTIKNGETKLAPKKAKAYLADGRGTELALVFSSYEILINPASELAKISVNSDLTPPVIEAQIIEEPVQGQKLLAYRAYDYESGINYTLLRFKKWFIWGEWINSPNPIVLPSGVWAAQLKTINNNGVLSEETLILRGELLKKVLVFLGIIILVIAWVVFYNKSRLKR